VASMSNEFATRVFSLPKVPLVRGVNQGAGRDLASISGH
jgi:hypothetical protein